LKLVVYPTRLADFKADPKAAAAASGLNAKKQEILLSGDLKQILDELTAEYGPGPGDHFPPGVG
jgi:hypothetical protein